MSLDRQFSSVAVATLTGKVLAYACARVQTQNSDKALLLARSGYSPVDNQQQWEQLSNLEEMAIWPDTENFTRFFASADEGRGDTYEGSSYGEAVARCYVGTHFGETVPIPDALLVDVQVMDLGGPSLGR